MPNVTDPSLLTSGVSQAPPEPRPIACTPLSGPRTVLNLHSSSPVAALSARRTPPPGPDPYALARYTRPAATCGWISNVPWPVPSRWLSAQIFLPVRALSAKTVVGEIPYTVPSATATPSGPGPVFIGVSSLYSHFSLPVASASAYTFASRSWIYTTPFTTIGFAARAPSGPTPAAAGPVMWNVQACLSPDTFADVIVEPA